MFDRFHDAWLEAASADSLLDFLKARAQGPEVTAADHRLLGLLLARQGKDSEALAAVTDALKLGPDEADAWLEKARLQTRQTDFEGALESLMQASDCKPADLVLIEIARLQGRTLLRLNRTPEALEKWMGLMKEYPDDLDLAEDVVELMAEEGLYAEAAVEAERLLGLTKDASEKLTRQLRVGELLLRAEKRDEALVMLEEALKVSGQDSWVESDVLARLDQVFRREDDMEGLKARLEALLEAHPGRVQLGIHHARVLAELGDADGAARLFRDLLGRNPGRRDLQESYISLLESLERTADAAAQLLVLAAQHPEDKELVIRLAGLQQKQGDLPRAQASLDSYLVKSAVSGTVPENDLLRVARLLETWEAKEAARGAYEKLAASFAESVSAQEALAHFYHRAEEVESAMKIWKDLTAKGELEDVLRVGQALMAHGHMKEAQSLVQTRLVDFSAEARLLSLLTQMAMANQDFEKAVVWSRARLLLVQDASGLQEAMKMAHHSLHQAKTADKAMEELIARQEELKVPERCLLAALLEDAGKQTDAIEVLNSRDAASKDRLLLDKQKVRIFELRQQWEQAAEVLTRILQLPEGRTSDHIQQLAQLQRRLMQHDKALATLQEWKALAPGSIQPWLEEHSILLEMARQTAALDVLRAASRKFSDNADVMSSLANALVMAGRSEEAREAYMGLYEQTEDPVARLRFLTPLAQMAQSTGKLPQLLEDFQQRQRQNRGSALPWLALASLHAATGQDEERRRCLYEASALKPKDLSLLTEIARIEEENGLFEEAQRTLTLAAKLDKTDASKQKMAALMIASGDEEAGYRLMFDLAGLDTAGARAVEQMADKLCEHGQWERAVTLLNTQLPRFPKDYRLHYLHAVALEEAGMEKEAVSAFLRLMDMHEELPEVLAAAASSASSTAPSPGRMTMRGQMPSLPPGTEEWMQFPAFSQLAYQHKQKQNSHRGHGWMGHFNMLIPGTPGLPSGWVTQPPDVTRLSGITLCHLVEISQGQTQEEKVFLSRQLTAKGIMDAELLLAMPVYQGQLAISTELLDAYPEHLPLHTLWLMNQHQQMHEDFLPVLERCVDLFQPQHPHLAFGAGMAALAVKTPEADALALKVLQTGDKISDSPETCLYQLLSALHTRMTGAAEEDKPAADIVEKAMKLAWKWTGELDQKQTPQNPSYILHLMAATLIALDQWDGLAGLIEKNNADNLKHAQANQPRPGNSYGYPPGYVNLQPMQPVWKGLDVSPISVQFLASLHPHPVENNYTRGVSGGEESLPKLATVAGQVTTPGLKIAFSALLRDEAAVRTGLREMLSGKDLKADHFIFAAYMAQQMQDWPLALGYLLKAMDAQPEATQRSLLDSGILYAALQITGKGESLPETVHATVLTSFETIRRLSAQAQNAGQLISVAQSLGFDELAKEMQQQQINATKSASGRTRPAMVNPYSRSRNRSSPGDGSHLGKLLAQNQDEAAYSELKKEILALSNTWSGPNWSNADHEARNLRQILLKASATSRYLEKVKTEPTSTWKMDRARGAFLELMGEPDAAIGIYQSVVKKKPNDWIVHLRLASLLSDKDLNAALSHLLRIPIREFTHHAQRLLNEMSRPSGEHHAFEHRLAVIRLMTAYVEKNADLKRRPDPNLINLLQSMPHQIQEGGSDPLRFQPLYQVSSSHEKATPEGEAARARLRQAHDDFCLALMKFPHLAQAGFGPYAGLAIHDGESLEKLEPMARQYLERQARMRHSMPHPGHGYDSGHRRYLSEPGQLSNPHPEDILLRLLLAQNATEKIESELLPLIKRAAGSLAEGQMREYARMYTCQEADFLDVAKSWARRVRPQPSDREIIRIWAERRLTTPIHDLFLAGLEDPQMRFNAQETGKYIETLHNSQIPAEASRFLSRVRDIMLGEEPGERADLLRQHHETFLLRQRSYHNPWQGSATRMAKLNQYVSLLSTLAQTSAAPLALNLAREDGLLDLPNLFSQICGNLAWERAETSTIIASLEAMGIVGPAAQFRPWMTQGDDKGTYLKDLLYKLIYNDEFSQGVTAALKEKVEPSFGRDLLLALAQKQEKEKQAGLASFLEQRGQELQELGPQSRIELAGFFSSQVPGYPHFLEDKFKAMLEPLFTAERQEADKLTDQLLAAPTWEAARLLHPNPDNRVPELIESMVVTDRDKALKLLEHYHELLTKTPQQQQARSQDQGPVAQLLSRMGSVPSLMNEVLTLAEKEGLGGPWHQSYYYQLENAGLNKMEPLLAIFRDTPFVAEADHFRCLPLAIHSDGSALLRLTRRLQNSVLRPALVEDLQKRQPQTFGVRLTLALLENKITDLDIFIRDNTEDLKKLAPKEASALLASLSAQFPRYREPSSLPQELRDALDPLIKSQVAEDDAFYLQVMDAPSLAAIRMSAENRQELLQRLKRLISQKPKEGREMFGKLTLLITAETRSGGSRQEHYWLSECATVPELFTPAMKQARNAGLMTDPQWIRQVAGGLNRNDQLSKAESVLTFLKGSSFLADASEFDSYPVEDDPFGSVLGQMVQIMHQNKPLPDLVLIGLEDEPDSFGHRLLRAMLNEHSKKELCVFLKEEQEEIDGMPPENRASFDLLIQSYLRPLIAYSRDVPVLESLLSAQRIKAEDARKTLLGISSLQEPREAGGVDRPEQSLALIAQHDPKGVEAVLTHLLKLMREADAQAAATESPGRPSHPNASRFLHSLHVDPGLWRFMSREALRQGMAHSPEWSGSRSCMEYFRQNQQDDVLIADALIRCGLFGDAGSFSTLPGLAANNQPSLFAAFIQTLRNHRSNSRTRAELSKTGSTVSKYLDGQSNPTFGMSLMKAVLATDTNEAMNEFVLRHADDFEKLPARTLISILDVVEKNWTALKNPEALSPELKKALGPVFDSRQRQQLSFMSSLLESERFEDLEVSQAVFSKSCKELIIRLHQSGEGEKAMKVFEKTLELIEERQKRAGWDHDSYSGGWTVRSGYFMSCFQAEDIPTLGLGLRLLNEDVTGNLTHNGLHASYNWGYLLFQRWQHLGGRADPGYAMENLLTELKGEIRDQPVALMALAFHQMCLRMQSADVGSLRQWADKLPKEHASKRLAREYGFAATLYLEALPEGVGPDGTCLIQEAAALTPVWKHYRAAIMDENLNPRVRIALGHHLCDVYPWAVPPDVVMPLASLAAEESLKLHSVRSHAIVAILRCFGRIPDSTPWRGIATRLWEGWMKRHSYDNEDYIRRLFFDQDSRPGFALLHLAGRMKKDEWIDHLLGQSSFLKSNRATLAGLVDAGYPEKAAAMLNASHSTMLDPNPGAYPWHPDSRKNIPAFLKACADPGLALLGELIVLQAADPPVQVMRAYNEKQTLAERIGELAPLVATTAFTHENQRLHAASIVASYAPLAAYDHLGDLCAKVASNGMPLEEIANLHHEMDMHLWLIAVHLVRQVEAGNTEPWTQTFQKAVSLKRGGKGYVSQRITRYASAMLSALWERGEAREAKKWLPVLQELIRINQPEMEFEHGMASTFGFIFATQLHPDMESSIKTLTPSEKVIVKEKFGHLFQPLEIAAAFAGKPGSSSRLTDRQRVNLVLGLLTVEKTTRTFELAEKIITRLQLMTFDEMLAHAETIHKAGSNNWGKLYGMIEHAVAHDRPDEAYPLFDILLSDLKISQDGRNQVLGRKVAFLIRTGKKNEAENALAILLSKNPSERILADMKQLQKILDNKK